MEYTLPALLLIQSCVIQGLFFDTMMSDCYGIPFMCNLQKKGDNYNQDNTSPFMAASLTETGYSNNTNNHQSVSNPASMSQHLSFSNGQSMTTEVSHNQEAVRNPFFQTQQNMVSGGLASSMHSIGHSTNTGHLAETMFSSGIVSGSGNPPKFGPGGMTSLQSTMAQSNSVQGERPGVQSKLWEFPGSLGMSHGISGGSGGRSDGISGVRGEIQHIPSRTATTTGDDQDTGVCEVTWTRCRHRCITIDPNNLCPVCTCNGDSKQPHVTTHEQSSNGESETKQTGCRSIPSDCPSRCVGFDEAGCTICICENGKSWYEDIWS